MSGRDMIDKIPPFPTKVWLKEKAKLGSAFAEILLKDVKKRSQKLDKITRHFWKEIKEVSE